jgi:hypothetical protein
MCDRSPCAQDMISKKRPELLSHIDSLEVDGGSDQGASSAHSHSVYFSTHLPGLSGTVAAESSFDDYIHFCLVRAFSGAVSPDAAIFIWDQSFILGL